MRIGQELKEAREAKDLSVTDIASAIRVNKKYIQALEDGNYLFLPSQVHAKGFLKLYANHLGLDAKALTAELVSYYKGIEDSKKTPPGIKNRSKFNFNVRTDHVLIAASSILVVALVFYGVSHIKRPVVTHPPASPFELGRSVAIKKELPKAPVAAPVKKTEVVKENPAAKGVTIRLDVLKPSKVTVWVNNKLDFSEQLDPGDIKTFTGNHIRVSSDVGEAIRITRDGITYGTLGSGPGPAEQNYGSAF